MNFMQWIKYFVLGQRFEFCKHAKHSVIVKNGDTKIFTGCSHVEILNKAKDEAPKSYKLESVHIENTYCCKICYLFEVKK